MGGVTNSLQEGIYDSLECRIGLDKEYVLGERNVYLIPQFNTNITHVNTINTSYGQLLCFDKLNGYDVSLPFK